MTCFYRDRSGDPGVTLNGKTYSVAQVEQLERVTSRFVAQAIENYLPTIKTVFESDQDLAQDVAEDLTREAIDHLGSSRVGERLYSKCDYKQSRYIFLPDDVVPQGLFLDSKAEKGGSVRVQMTQTTLNVRQERGGQIVDESPLLEKVITTATAQLLTTTVFVKYIYRDLNDPDTPDEDEGPDIFTLDDGEVPPATAEPVAALAPEPLLTHRILDEVLVVVLPSGALQDVYNPDADHSIWNVGANSPDNGEAFRTRINLAALAAHPGGDPSQEDAGWRVVRFPMSDKGRAKQRGWLRQVAAKKRYYEQHAEPTLVDDIEEMTDELDAPVESVDVATVESLAAHLAASYTPDELDRLFDLLTRPEPPNPPQA